MNTTNNYRRQMLVGSDVISCKLDLSKRWDCLEPTVVEKAISEVIGTYDRKRPIKCIILL